MDTIPGEKQGEERVNQSTISRFACRILADRSNPKICKIFAAGFDSSRNIFLGVSRGFPHAFLTCVNLHSFCPFLLRLFFQEKATKWQEGREIDGLTTNGVLIMHPIGNFVDGDSKPGVWREVSVGGGVFSTRESRSAQQKGSVVSWFFNLLNLSQIRVSYKYFNYFLNRLQTKRIFYKMERWLIFAEQLYYGVLQKVWPNHPWVLFFFIGRRQV